MDDIRRIDGGTGAGGYIGFYLVLAQLGRHGDDGAVQHAVVTLDDILHFLGGYVLAAAADDIFLAVHEVEVVVVIQPAQVAGEEPAVAEGGGGFRWVAPVAGHGGGVADGDFAGLAVGNGGAGVVNDADGVLKGRVGMAARLAGGVGAACPADGLNGSVAGFGHSEAHDDAGAETPFKVGQEFGGEGGGAVEQADGVVGVIGTGFVFDQDGHHHTDEVDYGGAGLAHLRPEAGGREAFLHHQGSAGGQGAHSAVVLGVGVEVGEAGKEAVVGGGLGPQGETLAGGDIHLMGDHYAFGVAGGAGGVLEH